MSHTFRDTSSLPRETKSAVRHKWTTVTENVSQQTGSNNYSAKKDPHTSDTDDGVLLSFRLRLAGNSDPFQSKGTLETCWYQVPGTNPIRHTKPTLAHLERFNVKYTIHATRAVTSSQMDPLAPVTYGNLLFKLHPFLSKLCQTWNFPYNILYYTYIYARTRTHTHTRTHARTHTHTHTHVFQSPLSVCLSYSPCTPSRKTPLPTPLLYIRLPRLFLPFNAKHGHTHTHKILFYRCNYDLYFMPFCFQHDGTSRRLNWPERDDQKLLLYRGSLFSKSTFLVNVVGTLGSTSLWLQQYYITGLILISLVYAPPQPPPPRRQVAVKMTVVSCFTHQTPAP